MYEGKEYSKSSNGMVGTNPIIEPSLRSHIENITTVLDEATKILNDVGDKLYIPRPQNEICCGENIPNDGTLESGILLLERIADTVRNCAVHVNSKI